MRRQIVAWGNRYYNHGRKVGIGRVLLECGHWVNSAMHRVPRLGRAVWCAECSRERERLADRA